MSATGTAAPPSPASPSAPARSGWLLRAEAHRLRSRRFLRLLVLLGTLAFAAVLVIASTQFSKPSAAGFAEAEAELERVLAESQAFHQQCLESTESGDGVTAEQSCGPPPTAESFGGPEQFLDERPFSLAEDGLAGALAVAGATTAVAFVAGATWIGAEWSTRSIVALLFWEPRRRRVMAVKLVVLAAATALVAAAVQAVWALAARVLSATRGEATVPSEFWSTLAGTSGRAVLLAVLVGLLGFGLANLMRNTAAALGVAFVYVVVVENAVRGLRPVWQEWLLTTNAAALVLQGGTSYSVFGRAVDENGVTQFRDQVYEVSSLQGGLYLGAVVAVVVGIGVVLFSRRDLG